LVLPDEATLIEVRATYERGLTVDAFRLAEAFAPLRKWGGVWPRVFAARIAANCGAPALALRLTVGAWRADRLDPEAAAQYAYETLARRGPLAVWTLLGEVKPENDRVSADLLALRGRAAVALRDFSTGEQFIGKAEALAPRSAWIRLQRAWLLEQLDRLEDALEVARAAAALHSHPHYRPATQTCAHLLQLLDRDDEASALLQDAMLVLQNAPIAAQLYSILSENGRWTEAAAALRQYEALAPLLEPSGSKWIRSQQARVSYHLGKRSAAATFAATMRDAFHEGFAQRLREPPPQPERVQLDIGFVRQHFKTCAPATLAGIARYWQMPADHIQLAEAMCYDGTPAWQQREWASNNGWLVREFRVTADSAQALLMAGIPFAISVVDATSAHMMAVIGFDRTRDVLLLRDPAQPYVIEFPTDEFLQRYRAFGPRGMIFVPLPLAERLKGIELTECSLHDTYHELCRALAAFDRDRASGELALMEQSAPDEALTWQARLELAAYDANPFEQVRCLDKLLEMFPGNATRLLSRLDCMQHASREDRIKLLEAACKLPDTDPALHVAMGRALTGDARHGDEAQRWLRRALRKRHTDWGAIKACADLLWEAARLDEATEYYRFAASTDAQREHLYQSWFIACRQTRRSDEALAHLEDRYRRFGARSDQPALTLAWAWNEMEQPHRAREVLRQAIQLRPQDGSLVLRAATLAASVGEMAEAHNLVELARGKVRENDWLRTRLQIAEQQLDSDAVLEITRVLLQVEPVAVDAHAALARAIARREGADAAWTALQKSCSAFPHHCGLHRLLAEWSRSAESAAAAAVVRELIRLEPSDAWAHRELAIALIRLKSDEEALAAALEAARIEPANSYSASTLAQVLSHSGRSAEAREQFRKAISASVDNNYAIESLLALARNDDERRSDIKFVERELLRQVVNGDGLLAYLDNARPIVESDQLIGFLRHAHAVRPDLWHAWGALVSQLIHMSQLDEARSVALQATQRFPHLPRAWCDLATVHQMGREIEQEIAALVRAFELNPAWTYCANALASAFERAGRVADAQATYERALSTALEMHPCGLPTRQCCGVASCGTKHWQRLNMLCGSRPTTNMPGICCTTGRGSAVTESMPRASRARWSRITEASRTRGECSHVSFPPTPAASRSKRQSVPSILIVDLRLPGTCGPNY
jgi:tetratricopeptide (TPR) repeat protein